MKDASETTAASSPRGGAQASVLPGLLWREWLAHRGLVMGAVSGWLVCLWVLLLFFHPGFVLAFGVLYAFLAGPAFGGAEASEGSEEFVFSLPPTRKQRYLVRLALGGGSVLVLTALNSLAVALDLPQALWGLVVESGFTRPFPHVEYRFLYFLAVAVPLAVFAFGFVLAAVANSRPMAGAAGIAGLLLTAVVLALGMGGEYLLWRDLNGLVSVPALLALSAAVLGAGYLAYLVKEGVSRPAPMAARGRAWVWIAVVVAVLALLFVASAYTWHRDASTEWHSAYDPIEHESDPACDRLESLLEGSRPPLSTQPAPADQTREK